ncbi:hypothetical protein [Streptomyces antibioticus]|uniref:hypothetical protein n=1 Tax=Streptomyces antibioticus TaxID=1890 RepID=UPI00368071AB
MPDLLAGSRITALDTPPMATAASGGTVTTTSTSFVTAGADVAVAFTAPTSGRVLIQTTARMINTSATSGTLISPETRTGSSIGSGTIIEAASDANGASHYGSTFARGTASHPITGLTPGAVYNTRLLMRSSLVTETASFANREITVLPVT